MLRPRILRIRGIWHCRTPGVIGEGFTPSAALASWRRALGEHLAARVFDAFMALPRP